MRASHLLLLWAPLISCSLTYPTGVRSEPLLMAAPADRAVWGAVGYDLTWVIEAAYAQRLGGSARLDLGVTAPVVLLPSVGGARAFAAASTRFDMSPWLALGLRGRTDVAFSRDPVGTHLGVLVDISLQPGIYRDRWSLAVDAAWRGALMTVTWPSENARALFGERHGGAGVEEAPRAVVQALASNRWKLGLAAAWRASDAVTLSAEGGLQYLPNAFGILSNPPVFPLPFFAETGVAWTF
jgi:hypothetical protein